MIKEFIATSLQDQSIDPAHERARETRQAERASVISAQASDPSWVRKVLDSVLLLSSEAEDHR